jgi:Spy/CpxP family protein refolding chaperone
MEENMKILQVLAITLRLSLGYALPASAASADSATEVQKVMKKPRHHRAMSEAMMKDLNLSDEQKAKWKAISEKKRAEIKPLREQMKNLREQEMKINGKYENEIIKILTPAQAEKYKSMLPQRPERPKARKHKK